MRILFFTAETEDYLSDSLLHGLRSILGEQVVDYPKADRMYTTYGAKPRTRLYGNGFTLYGLLEDLPVDRSEIPEKLRHDFFDLVIFGSIWRTWERLKDFQKLLRRDQTIFVDGEDVENIFPYSTWSLRDLRRCFVPSGRRCVYFKRELTRRSLRSVWFFLPPRALAAGLSFPKNVKSTSFSIPEEKIVSFSSAKTQWFPQHIVDSQVTERFRRGQAQYPFATEAEYYADLQRSLFGITTRRSGWDCMRHYEIAANGAVLCFRGLDSKERTCAPHGLDSDNCISYADVDDLMRKIERLSRARYQELRERGIAWARRNTTVVRANELLSAVASRNA